MLALSFIWAALVIVQLVNPNPPYTGQVENIIWSLFIVDFVSPF